MKISLQKEGTINEEISLINYNVTDHRITRGM